MKKILSLLFVLAFILSGCGSSNSNQQNEVSETKETTEEAAKETIEETPKLKTYDEVITDATNDQEEFELLIQYMNENLKSCSYDAEIDSMKEEGFYWMSDKGICEYKTMEYNQDIYLTTEDAYGWIEHDENGNVSNQGLDDTKHELDQSWHPYVDISSVEKTGDKTYRVIYTSMQPSFDGFDFTSEMVLLYAVDEITFNNDAFITHIERIDHSDEEGNYYQATQFTTIVYSQHNEISTDSQYYVNEFQSHMK